MERAVGYREGCHFQVLAHRDLAFGGHLLRRLQVRVPDFSLQIGRRQLYAGVGGEVQEDARNRQLRTRLVPHLCTAYGRYRVGDDDANERTRRLSNGL